MGSRIFSIVPNPSSSATSVQFTSAEKGTATVIIVDNTGKTVKEVIVEAETGTQSVILDLTSVVPGVYFVRVHTATGKVFAGKLSVQ